MAPRVKRKKQHTEKKIIKYTQSGWQSGNNTDIQNVKYVKRNALMKITNSWAAHTVNIGHTTNAILDN